MDATVDAPPWEALGPVGYYPFDGDATDRVYAAGALTCATCTFLPGRRGMAVRVSSEQLPPRPGATAGFTLAAWIYVPSMFPGMLAGCGTVGGIAGGIEFDDEPASVMLFGISYSPTSSGLVSITGDAWTHVAMTYVAATGTTTLFVDAAQRNSTTATIADSLDNARIGGGSCNVMIDDLFLFDRVLTAAEVVTVRDL